MLVKIHNAYRMVVAVCDSNLVGQRFEEGDRQIDLTGDFFKGEEKAVDEVREILEDSVKEDATFNFVGREACALAVELELIDEEHILKIQDVPVALALL